jgi:uncharacterized protein
MSTPTGNCWRHFLGISALMDSEPSQCINMDARDILEAKGFYVGRLGCAEYETSDSLLRFDLYGRQCSCRLNKDLGGTHCVALHYRLAHGAFQITPRESITLSAEEWKSLVSRVGVRGTHVVTKVTDRDRIVRHDQYSISVRDPSGNIIQFKCGHRTSARTLRPICWMFGMAAVALFGMWLFGHAKELASANPEFVGPIIAHACQNAWLCLH